MAKEKRNAGGDGVKPIEPVQIKIRKPTRYSLYLRLFPFCRKSRRKIQTAGRKKFQGVCPKSGASGPTRGARTVSAQSMKWARIRQGCKALASVVLAPQSIKHSETPRI